MAGKLARKIALVTGGSSGLGLATATRFVQEGAFVFITGRRQEGIDAAVQQIGASVQGIRSDSANLDDLDRMVEEIRTAKGRVDILFANAGIGEFAPLGQITEAHYDKTFDVNVKGTLFTVQKVLPLMPDHSSIVINASMMTVKGVAAFGVYAASKAALRSFARTWLVDLKSRGIRVNVVSPGTIVTPGYKSELKLSDEQIDLMLAGVAATTPLGRSGTADEVAKAVVFLASDDSSYVTGIELFVDGGRRRCEGWGRADAFPSRATSGAARTGDLLPGA